MEVRCPQCRSVIDLAEDAPFSEIACPSCGSSFSLLGGEETIAYEDDGLKTIGHFELMEQLGGGAFAKVWKARDTELDRTVAVKIPRKERLDPCEAEQFLREARAAAQLKHPNIVSVHEVGREADTVYIVSDYVQGLTLADWLSGDRPTYREAAELCATIACALHEAHECGVIHRDLKPANIMLDAGGEPHIMDFGLARREVGEGTMTMEGKVMGTPAYMSPEQAKGTAHQADRRSDIYSLGVVLFELLTGERPFRGNVRMLLYQVVNQQAPSPLKLNGNIPRDLETICLKCLRKEPGKRYATASDVAQDLRRFVAGEPIEARPITRADRAWRWCRRNPVVAMMTALVILLLLTGTMVSSFFGILASQNAKKARGSLSVAQHREKAARLAEVAAEKARRTAELTLADSYTQLGLRADEREDSQEAVLWFANAASLARDDPGRERANRVRFRMWARTLPIPVRAFSHRGSQVQSIQFHASGHFLLISDTRDGPFIWNLEQPINPLVLPTTKGVASCAAWSPDGGTFVLGTSAGEVTFYEFPGLIPQRTIMCGGVVNLLRFSPNGDSLAISALVPSRVRTRDKSGAPDNRDEPPLEELDSPSPGVAELAELGETKLVGEDEESVGLFSGLLRLFIPAAKSVVDVWACSKGQYVCRNLRHAGVVGGISFNSEGTFIATACADGYARVYRLSSGQRNEKPAFPPLKNHLPSGAMGVEYPQFRPQFVDAGRGILTLTGPGEITWWNTADGSKIRSLPYCSDRIVNMIQAGSGRAIIVHGAETADVWSLTSDGASVEQSFEGHYHEIATASLDPDEEMVLTGGLDRTVQLWDLKSRQRLALMRHSNIVTHTKFSPGGEHFATVQQDGLVRIWKRPKMPKVRPVTVANDGPWPVASRDGNYFAAWTSNRNQCEVSVYEMPMAKPAGEALEVGGRVNGAIFTPDDRSIVTLCSLPVRIPKLLDRTAARWGRRPGQLVLWDWRKGEELLNRLETPSEPIDAAFAKNGTVLIVFCAGGEVLLVNPNDNHVVRTLQHGSAADARLRWYPRKYLRVAPDDQHFATFTGSRVSVWDVASREPTATIEASLFNVSFSATSQYLAVASFDGTARVYDLDESALEAARLPHGDWVFNATFSSDGRHLLTACRDCRARVWDWRSGELACAPFIHKDEVFDAGFSVDGHWVLTCSKDRTMRVWDWQVGHLAAPPFQLPGDGFALECPPPGEYILVSCAMRSRNLSVCDVRGLKDHNISVVSLDELRLEAQLLSGSTLEKHGVVPLNTSDWLTRWEDERNFLDGIELKPSGSQ